LNVKVHKHPKWNTTPYPTNRNQNTSPQLSNFPQNQHQKFLPQYCYNKDDSFTPPKKLSENIWEPAKAGYGI
jgi:ribonuclease HI